jgi:light-regulated signal transduction histidine kinase (bacteriophytochrome)
MAVQKYDIRRPESEGGGFEERYWSPINSPVLGPSGAVAFIIHRVEDVTEFIRLKHQDTEQSRLTQELRTRAGQMEAEVVLRAQEVQEANRQLRIANEELDAFSYSVSHDLRAPLRSIDGFSQILLEDYHDKLDEQGQKYLRTVRESSQQMAQLIDDLLNLSRVSRTEIRKETVDLSRMADTIVESLRTTQPEHSADCEIEHGMLAQGDPHLLKVVLDNLLGNAWKYSSKRARARIEFGRMKENGRVTYFVRDNGAGFDMAYAHKLFGVFQRLHAVSEFPGTGIGLATVQRIIHRHGGQVWAEGQVEQGATVYFTL